MHNWPLLAALFLVAINGVTAWCFWDDKRRARMGQRRISEGDLLRLALIGGTPGALLARRAFRHKTRKQPFSAYLFLIALAQLAAMTALLLWR